MNKDYQGRKIKMSKEEQEAWLRDMAKLCIDMYMEELSDRPDSHTS
jgi:hypothetical protein